MCIHINGLEFKVQHNVVTSVTSPKLSLLLSLDDFLLCHPSIFVCMEPLLPSASAHPHACVSVRSGVSCWPWSCCCAWCPRTSSLSWSFYSCGPRKRAPDSSDSEMPTEAETDPGWWRIFTSGSNSRQRTIRAPKKWWLFGEMFGLSTGFKQESNPSWSSWL